jgi:hypothetical protein
MKVGLVTHPHWDALSLWGHIFDADRKGGLILFIVTTSARRN